MIRKVAFSVLVGLCAAWGLAACFRVGELDDGAGRDAGAPPDPHYLWHTFYGSLSADTSTSIAVDGDGNLYIAGWSWSSWDGPNGESPLHAHSGEAGLTDLFVLKLDSTGTYQWHTFYGSSETDYGSSVAVDGAGNAYVAGFSEGGWNGAGGEDPLHAHSGWGGFFVLKLDSDGAYQWHTFYGSTSLGAPSYSFSDGYAVAVSGDDNVYVTGYSLDAWTGPSEESPLHVYTGDPAESVDYKSVELFVLKLDSSGAYQWHTFYGSPGYDHGYSAAVDGDGSVYVVGFSEEDWTGTSEESPLHESSGDDLVVLKLGSDGAYQWHTFYGSPGSDYGSSVAVDGDGNVYVTGGSDATWTGPIGEDPLHAHSGDASDSGDLFVLKLDSSGEYQWHTFHGGDGDEYGLSVAVDHGGSVYVTGDSSASWDGPSGEAPLHDNTGYDFFVLELGSSGAYRWHTFYGAPGSLDGAVVLGLDSGRSVAVDDTSIYVAGFSMDPWNGPLGESPLHADSGEYGDGYEYEDLFVLKLANGGAGSDAGITDTD
jgi:hypothetical protein